MSYYPWYASNILFHFYLFLCILENNELSTIVIWTVSARTPNRPCVIIMLLFLFSFSHFQYDGCVPNKLWWPHKNTKSFAINAATPKEIQISIGNQSTKHNIVFVFYYIFPQYKYVYLTEIAQQYVSKSPFLRYNRRTMETIGNVAVLS